MLFIFRMLALIFFSLPLYASEVITGGTYLDSQGLAIYGESIYPTVKPGFTGGFVLATGMHDWCETNGSFYCNTPNITNLTCPAGTTYKLTQSISNINQKGGCLLEYSYVSGTLYPAAKGTGYDLNASGRGYYSSCHDEPIQFYWTIYCIPTSTP